MASAQMCTPCGHTFCGSCISKLRAESQLERCSMCRTDIASLVPNRFAENVLGTVNGTCRLCDIEFPLSMVEEHFNNCQNLLIQCGRCQQEFVRREDEGHQGNCPMMPVLCECGNEILRKDEAMHKERTCGKTPVACPLSCGNLQVMRWGDTRINFRRGGFAGFQPISRTDQSNFFLFADRWFLHTCNYAQQLQCSVKWQAVLKLTREGNSNNIKRRGCKNTLNYFERRTRRYCGIVRRQV